MKALQITSPNACALVELPEPELRDGHVLLQIRRIGYCGSDLNTYRGFNPLVSYPRIPGHEIAATVISCGAGVPETIRRGMDVTVLPYTTCGKCSSCRAGRSNACRYNQTLGVQRDGALTEQILVPWEKVLLAPGLNLTELAFIEPLSVGFHAVERGAVTATDTVVVLGCGMIGLGAISGAALGRGARVIAVDLDDAKLDVARQAGASELINSGKAPLVETIQKLTDGEGASVVIEAVGLPETFVAAVDAACFAGRVVYIGYAKKPVSYETKYFVMKELDIRGSRNATAQNFKDVSTMLQSHRYPVDKTLSRCVGLTEAAGAMQDWSANPGLFTKIQIALG